MRRRLHRATLSALAIATAATMMLGTGTAQADHYDRLLAPRSACPHQRDLSDLVRVQEHAMRCMHRWARNKIGRDGIRKVHVFQESSDHKSRDILRCQDFAHDACGRVFTYWQTRLGFGKSGCFGMGENLTYGSGSRGTVRSAMSGWLHSDGHREALLSSKYERFGVSMVRGNYRGWRVQMWTAHFGWTC